MACFVSPLLRETPPRTFSFRAVSKWVLLLAHKRGERAFSVSVFDAILQELDRFLGHLFTRDEGTNEAGDASFFNYFFFAITSYTRKYDFYYCAPLRCYTVRRRGFWRTIKQAGGENGTRKINNSLCRSQGIFFGTAFVCACCRYTRPLPRPLSGTSKALPPSIPFCPLRELSLPCPSFPLPPSVLPPKREKRRRATSFIAV